MRIGNLSALALAATLALPLVGLALEACGSEGSSGTTGARVTLRTRAVAAQGSTAAFTTGLGWTVTLSKAQLGVASLQYFTGEPIFSRLEAPRSRDPLRRFFALASAHAHPGHYVAGDAMGEMTTAHAIDLLAGGTALADGDGVTGTIRSGRLTYAPSLDGAAVALAEGTATMGASTLKFSVHAEQADVLDSYGEPKIDGCVFTTADVAANGTVTVTVDPRVWLDQVDFGRLSPSADGSPTDVGSDAIAFNGFARGLKKGTSVVFSFATP
jgi:hypothetical protein